MHVELVYVNCGEGADAAAYTALVEKSKRSWKNSGSRMYRP